MALIFHKQPKAQVAYQPAQDQPTPEHTPAIIAVEAPKGAEPMAPQVLTMQEKIAALQARSLAAIKDKMTANATKAAVPLVHKKTSLADRFFKKAPSSVAAYDTKVQQEADAKAAMAPKKLMSLAEKLAQKKAAQEAAELAEEPIEALPSAVADADPEVVTADVVDDVVLKAAFIAQKNEALAVATPAATPAESEPAKLVPSTISTTATQHISAVIEVDGKNYDLAELAVEIARLEKTSKILKSSAILLKLQRFQEAKQELEVLIDEHEEMEADSMMEVEASIASEEVEANNKIHSMAAAVAEVFNGDVPADAGYQGAFSLNIHLNERQLAARELAMAGKSFCLIGAAGTGKTTAQRSVAEGLLESDRLGTCSYKLQGQSGVRVDAPSFVACAYTRRASANLARAIHKNPRLEQVLRHNIMTIHALLEYEPVVFWDAEKERESMRFEPQRHAMNPLTITHLAIEEASMVGLDLWERLYEAMPTGVQIIFIGDLNQLPPVFGPSILNYALVQLPIIELTHVYRQAGDSLILTNAHNILSGKSLAEGKGFEIIRGKSEVQVGQERMAVALSRMFELWYDAGTYLPDEDMILSPFNKQSMGTDNMNKWIAQFLGAKRHAIVHEVIAGFAKHYLAVGDRVMVNKQDGYITKIVANGQYHGQEPQLPGSDLTRFGVRIIGHGQEQDSLDDVLLGYTDFSLEELEKEMAERKQQASHLVDVLLESGQTYTCSAAGDFSPQVFSLGYVLTVHKAQGCEFRKVFVMLHKDHSVMLFRELLYTAVTRAREEIALIAKDWVLDKAIKCQRIKGNSLEDKLEYFNSGAVDMLGHIKCVK